MQAARVSTSAQAGPPTGPVRLGGAAGRALRPPRRALERAHAHFKSLRERTRQGARARRGGPRAAGGPSGGVGRSPSASPLARAPRAAANETPAAPGTPGLSAELREALDDFVRENPVVAFIKGSKSFPQCGFSNTVVQILNELGVEYTTVDVLADERLRSGLKEYSSWPTFPQIYLSGQFFGGSDILLDGFREGNLPDELGGARPAFDPDAEDEEDATDAV